MNTNTTIAIIVVLAVALGGWFLYSQNAATPAGEETATSTPQVNNDNEEERGDVFAATVEYSDTGFAPKAVTIKAGETVRFVNTSSHDMWVASASHPTHSKYDNTTLSEHCSANTATNGTFDQCQAVTAGSMWDYTFTKAGVWAYHNHSRSADFGSVTVEGIAVEVETSI